jgi:tRNA 2-thiouridine synthesizing protein A
MPTHLDCKGLKCPMPIVRLSVAARELRTGDEITIEADDLAFRADLNAWARRTQFDITEFSAEGPVQHATLIKRSLG